MTAVEEQFSFKVEWFDAQADLLRTYAITFYPRDNSVSMYDPKNKRVFLKRSEYADIGLGDFHIGGSLTIHGRQLEIVDYGDSYSRRVLETKKARTLGLVKPDAYSTAGKILAIVQKNKFGPGHMNMVKLSLQQAQEFCKLSNLDPQKHAQHLSSDVVIAMELVGDDAITRWGEIVADISSQIGQDEVRSAVHGSADAGCAQRELDFFFGGRISAATTAVFNNCTLCIIRPHIFQASLAGDVLDRILSEGFEVSAMKLTHLDMVSAEEFLDVYRGVLPEYQEMCKQLTVGPALVLEIRQESAVESFRRFVGPHDPEIAKHLQPDTLRAQFGVDRVRNAVHCTDLPEDGLMEVEYFFNVLHARDQKSKKR